MKMTKLTNTKSNHSFKIPPNPSLRGVTSSRGPSTGPPQVVTQLGFGDGETPRVELANRGFSGLIPLLTFILSMCLNAFDCHFNAMVARVGTRVIVVIAVQTL
jgi:hypothetical protein